VLDLLELDLNSEETDVLFLLGLKKEVLFLDLGLVIAEMPK